MTKLTPEDKRLIVRLCIEDRVEHPKRRRSNGLHQIIADEFGIGVHYVSRLYRKVIDSIDVSCGTYKAGGVNA